MVQHDYLYRTEITPFRACTADQRFSYTLYVPPTITDFTDIPIIVSVHGSSRSAETYRDRCISIADTHRAIVLSPLFPVGIGTPTDLDDYKFLEGHGIRYDTLLLAMIKEVVEYYHCRSDLYLYGFSGGGQFVHRFVMLYPEMVKAVSIGAPGLVTLPRTDFSWWVGCADVQERFGREIDWKKLKQVPVQMLVGENDTDLGEITIGPNDPIWIPGIDITNRGTRIERLATLRDAWRDCGITVEWVVIPAADHDGRKLWPDAEKFLSTWLTFQPKSMTN